MTEQFVSAFQTSITATLTGTGTGVAVEALANKLSDYLFRADDSQGLGKLGMEVILRTVTATAGYLVVSQALPSATDNVMFGFMFFMSQPGLTRASVGFAKTLESAILP